MLLTLSGKLLWSSPQRGIVKSIDAAAKVVGKSTLEQAGGVPLNMDASILFVGHRNGAEYWSLDNKSPSRKCTSTTHPARTP